MPTRLWRVGESACKYMLRMSGIPRGHGCPPYLVLRRQFRVLHMQLRNTRPFKPALQRIDQNPIETVAVVGTGVYSEELNPPTSS